MPAFSHMENSILPASLLDEAYRFALLLTGSSSGAEKALLAVITASAQQLDQLRSPRGRDAALLSRVREQCLRGDTAPAPVPPSDGESEIEALARNFCAISEPERSALALFYLETLEALEIAEFLGMRLDDLAETLDRGRTSLREAQSQPKLPA